MATEYDDDRVNGDDDHDASSFYDRDEISSVTSFRDVSSKGVSNTPRSTG